MALNAKLNKSIKFTLYFPGTLLVVLNLIIQNVLCGTKLCRIRTERIGHLMGNVDFFLLKRALGLIAPPRLIFCGDDNVCNEVALDIVKNSLKTYRDGYCYNVAYELLNRMGITWLLYNLPSDQDIEGVLYKSPVQFILPRKVLAETEVFLDALKVGNFFSTIVRDQAYLRDQFGKNFDYHDYRNADQSIHFSAANKFAEKYGLLGVRMGALSDFELSSNFEHIVDYVTHYRKPSLDIGLVAKCLFFSNCGSGFSSVPRSLRKPMINVNQVAVNYSGNNVMLFIPKKLWLIEERRFLKYHEIINSEVGYILESQKYRELGIELVENTEEEIFSVHEEAYLRIQGNFDSDVEIEKLNSKIAASYRKDKTTPKYKAPIGQSFLRENIELFS